MTQNNLNIDLQKLQSESVNNGGIWSFIELPSLDEENINEYFKSISKEVKIESIFNENTKELIIDSIDYWSAFSGPCPEHSENTIHYNKLKETFMNNHFQFINKNGIIDIYRVEHLDSWLKRVIETGIDHMNENIIFQTENSLFLLHLGFSS